MGGTFLDIGYAIFVDSSDNVYTTGFFDGTVDFNPGPGVFNLTSQGARDIFISKLDSGGNFVWARAIGGPSTDTGNAIFVDPSGNVYTTGYFGNTVDFDPGPGLFNLTASGGIYDIFVSKLDSGGNFVWAKAMGGGNSDIGDAIFVDISGNVYTTGFFYLTVDFDPGPGSFNLTSAGESDFFISKLDSGGNFAWAKAIGGTLYDGGTDIVFDTSGSIFILGYFMGTVDFDTGPGVFNVTSNGQEDIFIGKLDNGGNFGWAKAMGGTSEDNGSSIIVDTSGNIYTTGYFNLTADFDPGPGSYDLTSAGSSDIFVSKLDSDGNFVWAKAMGGPLEERGYDIAFDTSGNLYTTGYFYLTVDFDPGPGSFDLTSAGESDFFISKLNSGGNFAWAKAMGGALYDTGRCIAVDPSGDVYNTGSFQGTVDFDPGPGSFNLTSAGSSDIFVIKLAGPFPWPMFLPTIISSSSTPVPPPPPPPPSQPETVISAGQVWMDRNLGASRVATSPTDSEAYGDLYQWGRLTDGHEQRTSPTTVTLSTTDVPGHGSFIRTFWTASVPYDWRTPQNDNLWQGVTGINNPCPAGFRLPTEAEWELERASWNSNDAAGAYGSPLKLVPAGARAGDYGTLYAAGSHGYYWSSAVVGSSSRALYFNSGAYMNSNSRAFGRSVRCIKD